MPKADIQAKSQATQTSAAKKHMKTPISDVSGRMKLGPAPPLAVKRKIGKQSISRTNRSEAALSFSPMLYAEGLA
jgi:hypothetical protein